MIGFVLVSQYLIGMLQVALHDLIMTFFVQPGFWSNCKVLQPHCYGSGEI